MGGHAGPLGATLDEEGTPAIGKPGLHVVQLVPGDSRVAAGFQRLNFGPNLVVMGLNVRVEGAGYSVIFGVTESEGKAAGATGGFDVVMSEDGGILKVALVAYAFVPEVDNLVAVYGVPEAHQKPEEQGEHQPAPHVFS